MVSSGVKVRSTKVLHLSSSYRKGDVFLRVASIIKVSGAIEIEAH